MKTKQTKNAKAKTTKKPATKGALGELLGHSVVSVIRAMGKAGWDYDTAKASLAKAGIEPAEHTIKIGLIRGAAGQKRIAPLTAKQLNSLRVAKKGN